jgi:hypothetical protein
LRTLAIITLIVGGVLGYGYWHSITHASFYIYLEFPQPIPATGTDIPKVKLQFLSAEGQVLANGISDDRYNFVHLLHPEAGDCHQHAKTVPYDNAARQAWQTCYAQLSTWIAQWANKASQVGYQIQGCNPRTIPATIDLNNSDWLLWWVPLPHIGGTPYAHYSLRIHLDDEGCIAWPEKAASK